MENYFPSLGPEMSAGTDRLSFLHLIGICIVTGQAGDIQAAHIRYPDMGVFAKDIPGVSRKPHDAWSVPLAWEVHHKQHHEGERGFWARHGFPPSSATNSAVAAAIMINGFFEMGNIAGARLWVAERALQSIAWRSK